MMVSAIMLALSLTFSQPRLQTDCQAEWLSRECSDNSVVNGYWAPDGWVPGYPDKESWMRPAPFWSIGRAVFYMPWVMEATAEVRGMSLEGYLGGVALMGCGDIGAEVWMRRPESTWEGPYLVVDCAARGDIFPIALFRKEVVEVDFPTAQRWGMVASPCSHDCPVLQWLIEGVEVSKQPPWTLAWAHIDRPIPYSAWWLSLLRLEGQPTPTPMPSKEGGLFH